MALSNTQKSQHDILLCLCKLVHQRWEQFYHNIPNIEEHFNEIKENHEHRITKLQYLNIVLLSSNITKTLNQINMLKSIHSNVKDIFSMH